MSDLEIPEQLHQVIPGLQVRQAGGACPFQAEGTLQGLPFYLRMRGGLATLLVGPEGHPAYAAFDALYSSGMAVAEAGDPHWIDYLVNLIDQLAKQNETLYQFATWRTYDDEGDEIVFAPVIEELNRRWLDTGVDPNPEDTAWIEAHHDQIMAERDLVGVWAESPEQAWERVQDLEPSPRLVAWGADVETWRATRAKQLTAMDRTPSSWDGSDFADARTWPDPEPVFEVCVPEQWRIRDEQGETIRIVTPWAMELLEERICFESDRRRWAGADERRQQRQQRTKS